jgi:hypothetical protein
MALTLNMWKNALNREPSRFDVDTFFSILILRMLQASHDAKSPNVSRMGVSQPMANGVRHCTQKNRIAGSHSIIERQAQRERST